jgi:hypothetical protein
MEAPRRRPTASDSRNYPAGKMLALPEVKAANQHKPLGAEGAG